MSSVRPISRPRLLLVGLGAALLIPLSIGPAEAHAPAGSALPAAGGTVTGTLVQAYADSRTPDVRAGHSP